MTARLQVVRTETDPAPKQTNRGFFAIGVWHPKREVNIGSLFRAARLFGASFVYTIGARYERQASDTTKTSRHIPLIHFDDIEDLHKHLPYGAPLVGVELDPRAEPLATFEHPAAACYLLGAEDHGLSLDVRDRCHRIVQVETVLPHSMNVACAGSILLHDRHIKQAN